jgi:hypothetical protein
MPDRTAQLGVPGQAGPTTTLKFFKLNDEVIEPKLVEPRFDCWVATAPRPGFFDKLFGRSTAIPLFAFETTAQGCLLVYRAKVRADELQGQASLEMWYRVGGREYFSKSAGAGQVAEGGSDWVTLETPFYLTAEQRTDSIRLNLLVRGEGRVQVKDVEVLITPLT